MPNHASPIHSMSDDDIIPFQLHADPLRSLLECLPTATAVVDLDGCYVMVNRRWREYFGWNGCCLSDRSLREDAASLFDDLQTAIHTCLNYQTEVSIEANVAQNCTWKISPWLAQSELKGIILSVENSAQHQQHEQSLSVRIDSDEIQELASKLQQETLDRQQLEQELQTLKAGIKRVENQYQQILNTTTDLVLIKGADSQIIWANRAFCNYHGMTNESLQAIIDAPYNKPDYTQQYIKDDAYVFTTGQTLEISEPVTRHDGEIRFFNTAKSAIKDENGEIIMTVGISHDITEKTAVACKREQLDRLIQQMPIAIIEWDKNFQVVQWNLASERTFGYSREELLEDPVEKLVPAQDRQKVSHTLKSFLEQPQRMSTYNKNLTKDGRVIECEWHNAPLFDSSDQLTGIISMAIDITERKQAEVALQDTQNFLKSVLDNLPISVVAKDADTLRFTLWNPGATKVFGYAAEETLGKNDYDLFPPEQAQFFQTNDRRAFSDRRVVEIPEKEVQTATGATRTLRITKAPILDEEQKPKYLLAIAEDITTAKQAEAKLREQEQFLRSIYDGVDCCIFVVDVLEDGDFHYVSYNSSCEVFTGLTTAAIAGKTPEQMFGEVEGAAVRKSFQQCVTSGIAINLEEHITFRNEKRWLFSTFNPIRDQHDRIYRLVCTAFDVTQLKETQAALQAALQESEYQSCFLRTVIDSSPDWIFAKDRGFRYILANPGYAEAIGKTPEEILGKTDVEIGFPEEMVFGDLSKGICGFRTNERAVLTGKTIHKSYDPITVADGSVRILDTRRMPLRDAAKRIFAVLGVSRDLTDRYEAEEVLRRSETKLKEKAEQLEQALQELQRTQAQLVQTEKMSSLGQLVAGVAHEINNPVNFIYGNLSHADSYTQDLLDLLLLYQQHYPQPAIAVQRKAEEIDIEFLMEDLPKLLNSMRVGADRIQKIVASLRTFSRMDEAEMKQVNIHDGIESTLMILQNRLKAKDDRLEITVLREYGTLPPVECYAGQLNQVFMNILSNAIDALEESLVIGHRALIAHEEPMTKDKGQRKTPTITIQTKTAVDRIVICIADNGIGMPKQVQQRLFDPFFTTKPIGKGTGMGLSISYQIVTEKHGGTLHCVSEPGRGTEFIIQIPLRQSPAVKEKQTQAASF